MHRFLAATLLVSSMVGFVSAQTSDPRARTTTPISTAGAPHVSIVKPIALKPMERAGVLRTSEGLRKRRLPNGATLVDAQGRFREFIVVSTGADGMPRVGCVHGERALRLVLEGRALPPARYEDR